MNFILVPLHTGNLETSSYSDNTTFYVYAAFFNVLLTYGMETSFFRFFNKSKEKERVFSTTFISLIVTTLLFFVIVLILIEQFFYCFIFSPNYFKYLVVFLL